MMRSVRSAFFLFAVAFTLPTFLGCGGGVETAPATAPAEDDGDIATEGMTPQEAEEFEAGEEGA